MEIKQVDGPRYRWVILFLLFVATTILYYNRMVFSVTAGYLMESLEINETQYGYGTTAFQFAYMIGFLIAGRVIDLLGTRTGLSLSMLLWSLAGGFTAICVGPISLCLSRGVLGLTQACHFPGAIKAVAEWFPARQRAFATSLFNSGPSLANMTAGLIVLGIISDSGLGLNWTVAYYVFAASGLVLAVVWFAFYRSNSLVTQGQHTRQAVVADKIRWVDLIKVRRNWGLMICKFCGDPVWWFYMSWLPVYLLRERNFDLKGIAYALPVIYGISILLSNVVGWTTGYLIKQGYHPLQARKLMMLVCAACMPLSAVAGFTGNAWAIILLVGLACGAHSGWSANNFTLASDCVKKEWVGSLTGLGGFAGAIGGFLITGVLSTFLITHYGYSPIFILMGCLHPLAALCLYLLVRPDSMNREL